MPIYSWIFSVSPTYLHFSTTVLFLFRVGQNPTPYYFLVQNIAIPTCQLQHHICIRCLDQSKQALVLLIETVFVSLPSAELTLVFCSGLFLDARESPDLSLNLLKGIQLVQTGSAHPTAVREGVS